MFGLELKVCKVSGLVCSEGICLLLKAEGHGLYCFDDFCKPDLACV